MYRMEELSEVKPFSQKGYILNSVIYTSFYVTRACSDYTFHVLIKIKAESVFKGVVYTEKMLFIRHQTISVTCLQCTPGRG